METRTAQFLAPAEALTETIGQRMASGDLDPDDQAAVTEALRYGFAAAPQLNAAAYADLDGWLVTAYRLADGGMGMERQRWTENPTFALAMQPLREGRLTAPGWGMPLYIADIEETLIFFHRPVERGGAIIGAVVATISVRDLSAFMASIMTPGEIGSFILYGTDRVLAHPALAQADGLMSAEAPLPGLADLGEPGIAAIWREGWKDRTIAQLGTAGHWTEGGDDTFVYLYDRIDDARAVPWLIGGYFRADDIGSEWQRVNRATAIAGVLLLLSLIGAVLLGRRLAGPAAQIVATARAVSMLRLDEIEPMQGSRIREIDEAERSLDAMVGALRCFIRYLPADLVHYVLRHPERDIARPTRRPMTIMFTDISGFTALTEHLDPETASALLNEHFADLEACIRATDGVIDKYMGDGLLAFWGAPDPLPDHPGRAIAAALAMAGAIRRRNATAAIPLRVRISVATGEILVGDLGAPARTNYTVIGDTVNLAQRLLQLGHALAPDHVTVIITTESCIAAIPPAERPRTRPLGEHQVRGRMGSVALVEVLGPPVALADGAAESAGEDRIGGRVALAEGAADRAS